MPSSSATSGLITAIQRGCTHDGPGIRTTVFLKGCPLGCFWCHNPETRAFTNELVYEPARCIACGACVAVCPAGAQTVVDGAHLFDRSKCLRDLCCADVCPTLALEPAGKTMTAEAVMAEAERDRPFYETSGGGLTLSGGEPMAQFEFARAILRLARAAGIHTCVETCGIGSRERFGEIQPLVDLFLWDIKDTDEERHRRNTGAALGTTLGNLRAVDAAGGKTILRCLLIAGINLDERHLGAIAEIRRSLRHCQGVDLLPYHPLAESKYRRLGLEPIVDKRWTPSDVQMAAARAFLDSHSAKSPIY
jgi:glycyl-radical enzyme activating protein